MKRLAACALLLLSLSGCLFLFRDRSVGGWERVGTGGLDGSQAAPFDLALDDDGTLYVAHTGGEMGWGTILVSRYADGRWSELTPRIPEHDSALIVRLLIAADGRPIACDLTPSACVVRFYDGSSWTAAPSLPSYAPDPYSPYSHLEGADVGPDGALYLALRDDDHDGRLSVLRLEGTTWTEVGERGVADGSAASLAWSAAGEMYVAAESVSEVDSSPSPVVYRYDGASWRSVGADSLPSDAFLGTFHGTNAQALAFDADDRPCIAVLFYVGPVLVPAVLAWNGVTWVPAGDGSVASSNSLSVALAAGPDGALYAAVTAEEYRSEVSVFRLSGGAWEPVGTPGFTVAHSAETPRLAFGPGGEIYVAYIATGADYEVQVMRHPGFGSP